MMNVKPNDTQKTIKTKMLKIFKKSHHIYHSWLAKENKNTPSDL
jgi:hypothetical protein